MTPKMLCVQGHNLGPKLSPFLLVFFHFLFYSGLEPLMGLIDTLVELVLMRNLGSAFLELTKLKLQEVLNPTEMEHHKRHVRV